jgi:hypothetical protein
MSEAQGTKTPGRPWHLWLIGIIGGLWSSIGVISFMLTQMNVEAVMSRLAGSALPLRYRPKYISRPSGPRRMLRLKCSDDRRPIDLLFPELAKRLPPF